MLNVLKDPRPLLNDTVMSIGWKNPPSLLPHNEQSLALVKSFRLLTSLQDRIGTIWEKRGIGDSHQKWNLIRLKAKSVDTIFLNLSVLMMGY